jgi:hypothetical protein
VRPGAATTLPAVEPPCTSLHGVTAWVRPLAQLAQGICPPLTTVSDSFRCMAVACTPAAAKARQPAQRHTKCRLLHGHACWQHAMPQPVLAVRIARRGPTNAVGLLTSRCSLAWTLQRSARIQHTTRAVTAKRTCICFYSNLLLKRARPRSRRSRCSSPVAVRHAADVAGAGRALAARGPPRYASVAWRLVDD